MKKTRLIPVLVAVMMLAAALLAGCKAGTPAPTTAPAVSDAGNQTAAPAESEPPAATPLKFKAMVSNWGGDDDTSAVQKAWLELMAKKMGRPIEIDYDRVPSAEFEEKSKLKLATADIPDFMTLPFIYDYSKVAADGLLLEISQYSDVLQNYMQCVNNSRAGSLAYAGDGKMYIFLEAFTPRFPKDKGMLSSSMAAYNYTVFSQNNVKIPATLDELYDAAKKLKGVYPNEYPVNTRFQGLYPVFWAHHTTNEIYWNGKEYVFGVMSEGYKESLQYLNKLYAEGLLDPEYLIETNDTIKNKAFNKKNFIWLNEWFTSPGEYTRTNTEGMQFAITLYPDNPTYGKCWQNQTAANEIDLSNWAAAAVSAKTAEPKELVRFLDLQYEPEVTRMITWGIEGTTYKMDGDKPTFIDELKNASDPWVEGNKYGMRASQKMRPGLQLCSDAMAFVDFAADDCVYYNGELHVEPIEKSAYITEIPYPQNDYTPPWYLGPKVVFTAEENQEISKHMTAINTYRDEMQSKFIKGEESFEGWQAFLDKLQTMGDINAVLKIYNDAAQKALNK